MKPPPWHPATPLRLARCAHTQLVALDILLRRYAKRAGKAGLFSIALANGGHVLFLAFAFAMGSCAYLAAPIEPPVLATIATALSCCAAAAVFHVIKGRSAMVFASWCLATAALGGAHCQLRANAVAAPVAPVAGGAITITGWVEQIDPATDQRPLRYVLRVIALERYGEPLARHTGMHRVRISAQSGQTNLPHLGDGVQVRAWIAAPPAPATPGAYDFARTAHFQRIGGVGRALSPFETWDPPTGTKGARQLTWREQLAQGLAALRGRVGAKLFTAACDGARAWPTRGQHASAPSAGAPPTDPCNAQLNSTLPRRPFSHQGDHNDHSFGQTIRQRGAAALVVAVITGDRARIPPSVADALRASGLGHILAISGLHMALIAGGAFFALSALFASHTDMARHGDVRRWAAIGALLVACGYLIVSGAAVSTQRAFIMAGMMFTAMILRRNALSLRVTGLAALGVLIISPESAASPGFHMSFAATAALIAAHNAWSRARRRKAPPPEERTPLRTGIDAIAGLNASSLIAGAATAPFAAYHFNRIANYALLGNALAMPVFSFWVMPFAVTGGAILFFAQVAPAIAAVTEPLATGLAWVAGAGASLVLALALWVQNLPGSSGVVAAAPPITLIMVAAALLALTGLRSGRTVTVTAAAWLAIATWWSSPAVMVWLGSDGHLVAFAMGDAQNARQTLDRNTDQNPPPHRVVVHPAFRGDYQRDVVLRRGGVLGCAATPRRPSSSPFRASRTETQSPRAAGQGTNAPVCPVATAQNVLACDPHGCRGTIGPHTVAITFSPQALSEDCARADLVVTTFSPSPKRDHGAAPPVILNQASIPASPAERPRHSTQTVCPDTARATGFAPDPDSPLAITYRHGRWQARPAARHPSRPWSHTQP